MNDITEPKVTISQNPVQQEDQARLAAVRERLSLLIAGKEEPIIIFQANFQPKQ